MPLRKPAKGGQPSVSRSIGRSSVERLFEVIEKILDLLAADRQADQRVADPGGGPLLGTQSCVRGERRPGDQGLDAAEARRIKRETIRQRHDQTQLELMNLLDQIREVRHQHYIFSRAAFPAWL